MDGWGEITRGGGEGEGEEEDVFGGGEGGKGDTGEDIKIMEWEINFISTFFNFYFCSFKGTLMQIWKSLYICVHIKTTPCEVQIFNPKNPGVMCLWSL